MRDLITVRRLKSELNAWAKEHDDPRPFPHRAVERVDFAWTREEQAVVDALRAYRAAGRALLEGLPREERGVGHFVFDLLTKRLLSSTYAFARTWWHHVEGYGGAADVEEVETARDRAESTVGDDVEKARREEDVARRGASWLARHRAALVDEREPGQRRADCARLDRRGRHRTSRGRGA